MRTIHIAGAGMILGGVALSVAYVWAPHSGLRTYTIEVHDGAFYPTELIVTQGDMVVFENTGGRGAWPASDPHPTHEYLSGFDAGKELAPGESWVYTFTEPGSWRFHDHLTPVAQGEIVVLNKDGGREMQKASTGGQCDGKCFDELVRATVEEDGIDAAYALFQETYEAGTLPRSCHWTAHRIGEAAYSLYVSGSNFSLSKATSYCGFGFYHGFLERLLRDNPDPARALAFCTTVEKELGSMGLQNCYHGIGHGFTEDPPDPKTIGNFQAMIDPGIRMCEYLFGDSFTNLNLCLTGVFTVPAGFADKDEYKLSMKTSEPFAYCANQPEKYLKACYGEFAPKLDHRLEWDLARLPKIVDGINDERLKRLVVWVVPSVFMAHDILSSSLDSYIRNCRDSFKEPLRRICWGGTILGMYSHGKPEKQYEKALSFCASGAWQTEDERAFCYGEALRQARQTYGMEKIASVCKEVPARYQPLCEDREGRHESPYDDPVF